MNTYPYHRVEYNFLTTFSFSLQNYQIMWKTPSILTRKILKSVKTTRESHFAYAILVILLY